MNLHRIWVAAIAALLAGSASACEHLSQHFELCAEGTPWATGHWVNGGDSATLFLGEIGFDGFEDYLNRDDTRSIGDDLHSLDARRQKNLVTAHGSDTFRTDHLQVVRTTDTVEFDSNSRQLRVTMIGEAGPERLLIAVTAPPDTPLDQLDQLSRQFAALIRLKAQ